PRYALYHEPANAAGGRLMRILGLEPRAYLALWRVNLCVDTWDHKAARARAESLLVGDAPWRTVVALGVKVGDVIADVSGVLVRAPFSCSRVTPAGLAVAPLNNVVFNIVFLPHPSGLNRAWHEPNAVARARAIMRTSVPDIQWEDQR